jgi:ferric-dicitrate binding protein FerR (iron transport regulator)
VGTEKRERQKANRALKHQQMAQARTRKRSLRMAALVVGGIAALVALVWVASLVVSNDDDQPPAVPVVTTGEPATTEPTEPAATEPPADES